MALFSSNSKRIYLVITALLIALVGYQILQQKALTQPERRLQTMMLDEQPPLSITPSTNPILADVESELTRAQRVLNAPAGEAAPASNSGPTVNGPDAWRMGDAKNPAPAMPLPGGVAVYEPVSVDMDSPAYPQPGERVSVTLPGGEQLQVNVETSSNNPNGDYTWRGHLDGHGSEYPVVMTYGGNSVFATVTTPQGSYTLESVNGSGWIYKNPAEVELSHPGANDYIEAPQIHD
ncbi:MAG TPA: hypothetical protein VLC79_02745 [Cellvibrio sp.]|nr:hypothetical protein [Cellvibrio sp.]